MAVVRVERAEDVADIHALHASSFPTDAEAQLVDQLRQAGRLTVSLVAVATTAPAATIVGHVAFSPVSTATGVIGVGLAPVAVVESQRRQGIAARLSVAGLDACRGLGFGWAVVLGNPAYYARFGFRPASTFGLSDEFDGGPAFQVLELLSGGVPAGAGLVKYSREFAAWL